VRFQDAKLQELVARYQNKVLQAGEEVENGIVDLLESQERVKHLEEGVKSLSIAGDAAKEKYDRGASDFTNVALIAQDLVRQQDQLALARGESVQALIRVYKALGGGWHIRLQAAHVPLHASFPCQSHAVVPGR
jgi:outer membrane protein TolC